MGLTTHPLSEYNTNSALNNPPSKINRKKDIKECYALKNARAAPSHDQNVWEPISVMSSMQWTERSQRESKAIASKVHHARKTICMVSCQFKECQWCKTKECFPNFLYERKCFCINSVTWYQMKKEKRRRDSMNKWILNFKPSAELINLPHGGQQ